jgi:ferredoxin
MKSLCDTCILKKFCQEVDTQVFECDDYREQ